MIPLRTRTLHKVPKVLGSISLFQRRRGKGREGRHLLYKESDLASVTVVQNIWLGGHRKDRRRHPGAHVPNVRSLHAG